MLISLSAVAPGGLSASPMQTNAVPSSVSELKSMSLAELLNVEVTSVDKQPEPYTEAPAAIQVITSDEIKRSGASSIPEALRLASSLDIAQKNSHDWAISARGFNTSLANKMLVLMDGRSLYTPLYSGVFWDVQDYLLQDIDRIEVISGPGGTLWGANAVNGVINITTKSAEDTQGLYTEAGGGNWLQDFAGARYGGMLTSNLYYRVYGKYFDRGDEKLPDGDNASDSWRMGQTGFRIDSEKELPNVFTLQGDGYIGNENLETGGDAQTAGGNILSRWTHTFSDDSDMQLQMYYDRTHLRDDAPALEVNGITLAPSGVFADDLDTYDIDFQHHFNLASRNNIVWGLGYRFTHEVEENAPSLAFFPAVQDLNLFSGFLQDEFRLWSDGYLTLGSKLEHNDFTGFEWEPSARFRWQITPSQMFWMAVSRAVRTPSRIDRDLSEGAPPYFVLLRGNADFESEKLIAYETGYRAEFSPKLSSSVSLFYNQYDDIRSTSLDPNTVFPLYFQNNVQGETYGAEFSAAYQLLDWWQLRGGYDFLHEHLYITPGQTDFNNALNEVADPENQFSLRSSMDLPANTQLDTGLRWVDTLHVNNGPDVGSVPSYFELEVRLAWHPTKNLELSVVGQNLLHDQHPEYGYPGPDREEIRRSIYGKVAWQF